MCRNTRPSRAKVPTLALSTFIQKKCKSTLKNISISSLLNKKFKKNITNGSAHRKRQRNQISSKQSTSDPSILDLLTMIGECDKSGSVDMSTEKLHTYTDRNVLKISNSWSKAVSNEKSEISLELDDENNVTDILIKSLSPDCACLEVEAMSLLAFLEHEVDEAERIELSSSSSIDMHDEEMEDEILRLDEAEECIQRELLQIDAMEELTSVGIGAKSDCTKLNEYGIKIIDVEERLNIASAAACA